MRLELGNGPDSLFCTYLKIAHDHFPESSSPFALVALLLDHSVRPQGEIAPGLLATRTHIPVGARPLAEDRRTHGSRPRGHGPALEGPTARGGGVPTRAGPLAWNLVGASLESVMETSTPRWLDACRILPAQGKRWVGKRPSASPAGLSVWWFGASEDGR